MIPWRSSSFKRFVGRRLSGGGSAFDCYSCGPQRLAFLVLGGLPKSLYPSIPRGVNLKKLSARRWTHKLKAIVEQAVN